MPRSPLLAAGQQATEERFVESVYGCCAFTRANEERLTNARRPK